MKKIIWIFIGVAVVVIIAAFFLLGPRPTNQNQADQTSAETIYLNQPSTLSSYSIELINITNLGGQTYAVLNIQDNGAQPAQLYIGVDQYVSFGNGGAPYVVVSQISRDSSTVNIVPNIPSGYTQAIKNGRQGNFVIPNDVSNEFIASTWTTDKPSTYSNLVTIVFPNSTHGVKYEFENGKGYMAEPFRYKISNGTISMVLHNSTSFDIPFTLSGDLLTINYGGQKISFNRDWQNMTYLTNKY